MAIEIKNINKSFEGKNKNLSVLDIDLSIGRHSQDNLQTKTQAFSTLVATGELAVIDCLELANLTNKTREMVERGKKEKAERQEEAIKLAKESANASGEGKTTNGANKTAEIEKQVAKEKNKE